MKKILMILGGIFLGFIALFVIIFMVASLISDKLVCKSSEGDITIMYTEKTITGYTANGITYDLDGQKKVFDEIGMDDYIKDFSNWFSSNTSGTCTKK